MAGITITVNDKPAADALARVIAAGKDLKPLFDDIGASLTVSTQRRFEIETDPVGRKWKPLKTATLRRKAPDTRILRSRGRLHGSLTHNATSDYVEWGTNAAYAAAHQFGASIEHFARSQRATFRLARAGAASKKGEGGNIVRVGSRLRFAKKRTKAKSAFVKPITIGAHTVTIPARPYLGLDEADSRMIIEKAEAYLTAAGEGA